jgi:hypothetical protein
MDVPIQPGTDSHCPAGLIEILSLIPIERIFIRLLAVAVQASWGAVVDRSGATLAARLDMINGS